MNGISDIIEAITTAARNRHTLMIQYTKKNTGEEVTHQVEPYEIKGEVFYGRRVDMEPTEKDKGTRAFLLQNIQLVQETQNTFEPFEGWEIKF